MSNIVIVKTPGEPIFGFGEDSDGVKGYGIGYWSVVLEDTKYLDLVTSEHADKPDFMSMVAFTTQPMLNQQATLAQFVPSYDLDIAIGVQLDVLGLWIGITRFVQIPIFNSYFCLDIAGVGLDEANWYVTGQALFRSVRLDDEPYRRLLQTKAAANRWDGTINGAYEIYNIFFSGTPNAIKIHDYQNMTYALEITGPTPSDTTQAIIGGNSLMLKPQGVTLLPLIVG